MRFTKMQGLGNDFVVIDGIRQRVALDTAMIRRLADRRYGVGCDQVLVAESPTHPEMDVRYRIFNADGSEVEHCGNGVRCLALFLHDEGLVEGREFAIQTDAEPAVVRLLDDGQVTVNMGAPHLDPAEVPFQAASRQTLYPLDVDGETLQIAAVSMGNPHAVLQVDDVDTAPVERLGPLIEKHSAFPKRVNAGFMQIVDRGHLRLRVFERGVGETRACGTGACAAMVAGRLQGLLDDETEVALTGGKLRLRWTGEGEPVWMTGPAVAVFQGEWPGS